MQLFKKSRVKHIQIQDCLPPCSLIFEVNFLNYTSIHHVLLYVWSVMQIHYNDLMYISKEGGKVFKNSEILTL